jgi:YD repeat-containing protein
MTPDPQKTPQKDFIVKQGASFTRVIKFRNQAGELLSLDGLDSALFFIRPDNSEPIQIITDGPADQNIVIDYTNKKITIFIADEVTDTYTWDAASYRFEVTDSAGNILRKLRGTLTLEKKV